jgi:chemotaxis protein methyltransferase CheR
MMYRKETQRSPLPDVLPYEVPPPFQKTTAQPQAEFSAAVLEQAAQETDLEIPEKIEEEALPSKAYLIRALADQGKLNEALALCEEALASDKLNPGLHFLRAIILQELNRIDEAGISLKRTLYLDQNFLLAHFALGNLELRQGNGRAAKKYFENVLTLLEENRPDDILPESEGLTAGRFREIILATMETGALA